MIYAAASVAWILVSDRAVGLLTADPDAASLLQRWKGLVFVLATAALIYWLVQRGVSRLARSHDQIAAREQYFRSLYENAPTAYHSLDEDGRLLDVNAAWLKLLGYAHREQVLGRPILDFLDASQHELLRRRFPDFKATGLLEDAELVMRRSDGGLVIVILVGRIQYDEQGRFVRTHCVLYDITARKNAEQGRRESERRLALALDGASLGTFEWNLGDDTVVWDARQAQLYGIALDQFDGNQAAVLSRVHPADLRRVKVAIEEARRHRRMVAVEYRAVWPDGSVHWLSSAGRFQYDAGGEAVSLRGVTMDVDSRRRAELERDQLEDQLRQAQKMEAVGQLAGGVAHDFNNLLQVINGYSEMVLDDLPADHPSRGHLQEVAAAGGRASRLVGQLLAFSRRQVLETEPLDLDEVVTDMLGMARSTVGEPIVITWRPHGRLGTIVADRGHLEQVFMNLCINARDAMPQGGELSIATGVTELDAEACRSRAWARPGRYVTLRIADTGTGMEPAVLERIWDPFFTTKPPGKGTGLGLSTVYGIVRQHAGLVNVTSEPGRGSTFEIYLPEARARARVAGGGDLPAVTTETATGSVPPRSA